MYSYKSLLNYKLYLMAALCFGIHTTASISSEKSKDVSDTLPSSGKLLTLSTPDMAYAYGMRLFDLSNKMHYEEAFQLAFPEPILPIEWQLAEKNCGKNNPLNAYEMAWLESYRFHRSFSLAKIYYLMGSAQTLKTEVACDFYQKSLAQIEIYISSPVIGEKYVSPLPDTEIKLYQHRAAIYRIGSAAYFDLAKYTTNQQVKKQTAFNMTNAATKNMLLLSIDHLRKVIDYTQKISPIDQQALRMDQLNLAKAYMNLLSFCESEESKTFLSKAKEIQHKLSLDSEAVKEAELLQGTITLYAERLSNRNVRDNHLTKISRSGKLESLQHKKVIYDYAKATEELENIQGNKNCPVDRTFVTIVFEHYQRLNALMLKNINNQQVIPSIKELEQKIQQELIASNSIATLLDIYQAYGKLVQIDLVIKQLKTLILPAFLTSHDIRGALDRVEVLSNLETQQGNNIDEIRWLRAAICNLNGDHSEWEKIEQETQLLQKENREKKDAEKKQQEQQQAARIRQYQQKILTEKEKLENSKQKINTNSRITPSTKGTVLTTNEDVDNQISSTTSLKEHKEAKMQRHEEAEIQREKQKNQENATQEGLKKQPNLSSSLNSTISEPVFEDQNNLPKISDLYKSLSRNSKKVDKEIEDDTWRFSRENLISYFRNLECNDKPGGKHPKVSLPQTTIITFKGATIAILNDLGGALTLPRWDNTNRNGQVPIYLRPQILKAREKLVYLKVKANNILNSLQNDTSITQDKNDLAKK
jgi:hypothetical protein